MRSLAVLAMVAALISAAGLVARAQESIDVNTLPFSAARHGGHTLYLSGQIPVTPAGEVVKGSITEQTHQTMENLHAILEKNGCSWNDVVKVSVFLSDMKHYQEMNAAYRTYFDGEFPARECVGGLQLALGADLEISCIAYKP